MSDEIAIGDWVALKDGSPPMQVTGLFDHPLTPIKAEWTDAAGTRLAGRFAFAALRKVDPADFPPPRAPDTGFDARYWRFVAELPAGATWRTLDDEHLLVVAPGQEPYTIHLGTGERTVIKPT